MCQTSSRIYSYFYLPCIEMCLRRNPALRNRPFIPYPNNGYKKVSIINCQLNASPSKNMFHLPRRPIQFRRYNKSQSIMIQQSCKLRFNFGGIKLTCKETFFFQLYNHVISISHKTLFCI